jgi:uncharacterized surface protein with fasciclin (FAS1) repeats
MRSIDSHRGLAVLAAASLIALGACSDSSKGANKTSASSTPSGQTLAQAIAGTGDLSTVSGALKDTGLSQVFDGAGSYTILAPDNAAFAKLGDAGRTLIAPDNRSQMAAVLRDHIVPGFLTLADIQSAIDARHGVAKIATMGNHELKFTHSGSGLKITNEDGSEAMIAGDAIKAGNGVAIPIDGVLKKLAPTG